ncbi:MAG: carbon storage regulator [Capsulimonadaceae bacterium]|nr:carbon storage regulator [Capsulimonadaceae bacterium]
MLFLTRQLNLKLQTGDRFEITVVETRGGGVSLGISAATPKRLRKAIVDDDVVIVPKQLGTRRRSGTDAAPSGPQRPAPRHRSV